MSQTPEKRIETLEEEVVELRRRIRRLTDRVEELEFAQPSGSRQFFASMTDVVSRSIHDEKNE